jgi:hypothetical protein
VTVSGRTAERLEEAVAQLREELPGPRPTVWVDGGHVDDVVL